ncbi:MAG: hypothetical protein P9L96_06720 [Candidatus Gygaella obscura]|nr:hypothetical protein [Candidatus Gygaella obscura]
MNKKIRSNKAFSILELVTSMTIFSFLTIFLFSGIITVRNIWLKSSAKLKLTDELTNAFEVMKNDLSYAVSNRLKVSSLSADYCAATSASSGVLILFPVPTVISGSYFSSSGSVQIGCDGDSNKRIRYRVDGKKLLREIVSATSPCHAHETKALVYNMDTDSPIGFSFDGTYKTLTITMNLEDSDFQDNEVVLSFEETVYLRN